MQEEKVAIGLAAFIIAVGAIFCAVVLAAMIITGLLTWGFVIMKTWNWFIFPFFIHVPYCSWGMGMGLRIVAVTIRPPKTDYNLKKDKTPFKTMMGRMLSEVILAPAVVLLIAYCVHLYFV